MRFLRLRGAKKRTYPPIVTWKPDANGTTFQNPYAKGKHMKPMMGQAVAKEKRELAEMNKARKRFSLKDWLRRLWIF